jgi:hypothetical protein
LAESQGAFDQGLGVGEPALEQGQERLRHADVPQLRGLLELLGGPLGRDELGSDARQVAELERRLQAPEVPLERALVVAGLARELRELGHDRRSLL